MGWTDGEEEGGGNQWTGRQHNEPENKLEKNQQSLKHL